MPAKSLPSGLKARMPRRFGSVAIVSVPQTVKRSKVLPPGTVGDIFPKKTRPSAVQPCTRPARSATRAFSRVPLSRTRATPLAVRSSSVCPTGDHSLKVTLPSRAVTPPVRVVPM